MRHGLWSVLAVLMLLGLPGQAQAQGNQCLNTGDLIDVPTPGYLKKDAANLFLEVDNSLLAVTLVSQTTSRLRIRLQSLGTPSRQPAKIVHVGTSGPNRVVATVRLCNQTTSGGSGGTGGSTGGSGGTTSSGTGGTATGNSGGGTNTGANTGGTTGGTGSAVAPSPRASLGARMSNVPFVRATRNEVAAPSGAPEYVIVGGATGVSRAQTLLASQGVNILSARVLSTLDLGFATVDLNGALSFAQARSLLAQNNISVTMDLHSVYRSQNGRTYSNALVGLPATDGCQLRRSVRIGLIDGPVDLSVPALRNVAVVQNSVLGPSERPGSAGHGTGIASLILGQGVGGAPGGVAQGAQLFSVIAFASNGGRDVARLENLALAMDWMLARKVQVVNMSLAGPRNAALEAVLAVADKRGVIMVAATGNAGRDQVAYPASDPRVIAVTAIDAAKRLYRKANKGPEVDFAAPGVDVLLPQSRRTAFRSGTSYATGIVTGLIAQELARGAASRRTLVDRLRKNAEDLGTSGRDPLFGWGLVKSRGC